jgi:hypothetical protein
MKKQKSALQKLKKLEAISENERPKHSLYNPQKGKRRMHGSNQFRARELTQEEARKPPKPKEYYKTLLGDH